VPFKQDREILSTIDVLVERSRAYRTSQSFREMIDFMGRFRVYAPYNVMLVRLQNASCSFFATAKDWDERFERALKEDARPMLILAPMHPVMLVYDLDQTEGKVERWSWFLRPLDRSPKVEAGAVSCFC
jgi:hypothetical protein